MLSSETKNKLLDKIDVDFSSYQKQSLHIDELKKIHRDYPNQTAILFIISDKIISVEVQDSESVIFIDRLLGIQRALYEMIKDYPFLKTAFILDTGDELQGGDSVHKIPLFGFCKKKDRPGILIPDDPFEVILKKGLEDSKHFPWERKLCKAFFRGGTTGATFKKENMMDYPRLRIVKMSAEYPDIIDAKFTKFVDTQFYDDEAKEAFHKAFQVYPHVDMLNFLAYRYLLDIDGNTNAWHRCRFILSSNSLCIKHKSPFHQWFYEWLKPGVHYLEIENDYSDLTSKIQWAESHSKEAYEIMQNGTELALTLFHPFIQVQYLKQVILKYVSVITVNGSY